MADENPENITRSTFSYHEDTISRRKFDYMITNPPYGDNWKSKKFIKNEAKKIIDLEQECQEHQMVSYYFYNT